MYENKPGPSVLFVKEQCSLLTGGKTCQQKKFLNWTKNDAADSMEKREKFAFLLVHYFPSTKMRGELEIDLVRFPLFIRRMLCQIMEVEKNHNHKSSSS